MEWPIVSIVQVNLRKETLNEEDLGEIGKLLRSDPNIDNLNVHNKGIAFFIWGQKKINYQVLDEVKNALKSRGYLNFSISAHEYKQTQEGYSYSSDKS